MNKRILFVISDTGGGHRSAANALITAMIQQSPGIECQMIDLLRASQLPLFRNAPEIYGFLSTQWIGLYNLFFRLSNFSWFMNFASRFLYFFARSHIRQSIADFSPDLVVVIHPLAVRPICQYRQESGSTWPVATVVTDLASIHASWAYPEADRYFLPTEEALSRILKLKVPHEISEVSGFPLHPRFLNHSSDILQNRQQWRQKLRLPPENFTILLTSGGAGGGSLQQLVQLIETHLPQCTLLVITGKNEALLQSLSQRKTVANTFVFGFVHNMDELMLAADIVVTKAGPGTVLEAATLGIPLVITGAVGLQEEGNIDFALANGLGAYCRTPQEIIAQLSNGVQAAVSSLQANAINSKYAGTQRIAEKLLTLSREHPIRPL